MVIVLQLLLLLGRLENTSAAQVIKANNSRSDCTFVHVFGYIKYQIKSEDKLLNGKL